MSATAMAEKPAKVFIYRHTVLVRVAHSINLVAITFPRGKRRLSDFQFAYPCLLEPLV